MLIKANIYKIYISISTIFGNSVDFHSGGIDLMFPHHENEEAQSCCYHEVEQWVNYWVYYGHLSLKHEKMSKSLKNTISIRKFLEKYTANQFRILCLLSNYKNGIVCNNLFLYMIKLFYIKCKFH